jgi:hypothetical protein
MIGHPLREIVIGQRGGEFRQRLCRFHLEAPSPLDAVSGRAEGSGSPPLIAISRFPLFRIML